jgi:hypothetical protein
MRREHQASWTLAELQRHSGIEAQRGIASNWSTQLSFPTLAAFTTDAPIGFIAMAEDTGLSYQFNGVTWVVFPGAATLPSIPQAFTKFVSKSGSDATGDGSLNFPYLTIGKAVTVIANAGTATQPWKISVGPGQFVNSAIDPWTFIVGAGRNATTLTGAAANLVTANWATAGAQDGGIFGCAIGYAAVLDYAAVAASATATFYLYDAIFLGFATSWTGSASTQKVFLQNVESISTAVTHTITNLSLSRWTNVDLRVGSVTVTNNAAYACNPNFIECAISTLALNCANAAPNTLTAVLGRSSTTTAMTFTGDGCFSSTLGSTVNQSVRTPMYFQISMPDADTTYTFGTVTAGALKLIAGAINRIIPLINANRTLTIADTPTTGTEFELANNSANIITLVIPGQTAGNGPTYVGANEHVRFVSLAGGWLSQDVKQPQHGRSTLVAGASPPIACDVLATSTICATYATTSATMGTLVALQADIVPGTRAGGGTFIIRSVSPAGAQIATDANDIAWSVIR